LEAAGQGNFGGRRSHYLCEQAGSVAAAGDAAQAQALLEQAAGIAPHAPRPRMDLARLQRQNGDSNPSLATLSQAMLAAPEAVSLIAPHLAQAAIEAGRIAPALAQLKSTYAETPSLDVLDAIVALEAADGDTTSSARDWYARHLEKEPSLVAAAKWIAGEKLEHEQFHPQVQRALDHAVKPLTRYRCAACGFEAKQHFWQCPGCQAWDSYPARRVEEL
jgi:lipopolysaccharide biosynthesis regulator YciM